MSTEEVPISPTGTSASGRSRHDKHCFIVMPFGRDANEQKWFRGWYEVVIKPAVLEAGFEAKLAAAEEQPGAINDEIRTHLALDPMVVVDLGGAEPEDEPNPNVMYELGIRHALGLPLVIIAWKGQRLPFDVSNQRVITEDRDLIDLEQNKKRLISFIHAAQQGKYYRPMEAVGRHATIQAASETLGGRFTPSSVSAGSPGPKIFYLPSCNCSGISSVGSRRRNGKEACARQGLS